MYVYVMAGPGVSKVGISNNVRHRFHQGRVDKRGITHIAKMWWCPVSERDVEREACKAIGIQPMRGKEQFAVPEGAMIAAVEAAMIKVFGCVLPSIDPDHPWFVGGRLHPQMLSNDPKLGPIIAGWFKQDGARDLRDRNQSRAGAQVHSRPRATPSQDASEET